jgi:hypothetical protein
MIVLGRVILLRELQIKDKTMDYYTLNKNLNEVFELLFKAAPNHPVFQGGKFAILTGEKPKYQVHPGFEGENDTLVNHLNNLKAQGHIKHFEPVLGHYGELENSYLVHSPNFEKIKELGHKFGQESVILSNNGQHHLSFTNGPNINKAHPHVAGEPVAEHQTRPADFFTETHERPTSHKKLLFTIPIDWDKFDEVKGKELGGQGQIKKAAPSFHQLDLNFDTTQLVQPHSDKNIGVVKAFRRQYGNSNRIGTI